MDQYAVIGHPVAHSLSPRIHGLFAQQTGEALEYRALQAPLDGFAATLERFFADGGRGVNVTVPFKGEAAAWVGELDPAARAADAVNTIVRTARGYRGHNTDGTGLVRDLLENEREPIGGRRVLVVGAGGAARGACRPLLAERPTTLVVCNRTPARAQGLAEALAADSDVEVGWASLDSVAGAFDLVINATSAGLEGSTAALPAAAVRGAFCYDMIYGIETAFGRWALAAGARRAVDGLGMLVEQAAVAFQLWRGRAPDTKPVLDRLRAERGGRAATFI